ncbi:hypothetical protein OC522_21675 [Vibrio vulnificus]|nr:hypothetical protein [Vibrio vulnificus]
MKVVCGRLVYAALTP